LKRAVLPLSSIKAMHSHTFGTYTSALSSIYINACRTMHNLQQDVSSFQLQYVDSG
jgi:hypothetical protein